MTSYRCSHRSEQARESLAGTGSTIRHWLLVEHPGPWGRDGLLDARLPEGLGSNLRRLERRTRARVLLIRRVGRDRGSTIACFAVDTTRAWLGTTDLTDIEDAAELDPREPTAFRTTDDHLAVVCTHGRRDPCCAERGRPLAAATADAFPGLTWESTHVGGDRFAGNLVLFPHGLYFGRVEPERAPTIVRAYLDGRIGDLDRYRGRADRPFHVQAAEVALRLELGLDGIDDLKLSTVRLDGDEAVTTFSSNRGSHEVRLTATPDPSMRLTCHSQREERPIRWLPIEVRATS